jgi:hypothetical protein
MLQMNCPKCKALIKSPFLAELSTIECAHCKDNVEVNDVFVATKSFTIHRDDLLKRIYRFQSLLKEVEKERLLLETHGEVSKTTQKSIEQFSAVLQELLVGARKNFRLELPYELLVEIECGKDLYNGKFVNLSSEGASVKCDNLDKLPTYKSEIKIKWQLPGILEELSVTAKIAWHKKFKEADESHYMVLGVNFVKLDENIRSVIWNFIAETASNHAA